MNARLLAPVPALAAGVALVLALAGCSALRQAQGPGAARTEDSSGKIAVVASTDVYGDIARAIGGKLVSVTSIIDDPAKDPHDYQANAQNQLSLSKATIVIENGGGYDGFIDTMLASLKNSDAAASKATVLSAADLSGYDQKPSGRGLSDGGLSGGGLSDGGSGGAFNEHLWYDFPTIGKVVHRLVAALSTAKPDAAATFAKNGDAFTAQLTKLEATESSLKARYAGQGVAITEPVPLYLLDAIGLKNKTPERFSAAVEAGTDVAPDVLRETIALYRSHAVRLLVYNQQSDGPQTDAVLKAAKADHIATVGVTETLPKGMTYVSWMTGNLNAISKALS